ncbi:MAG: flavodoxin reductase [Chitinophagales bacterium]
MATHIVKITEIIPRTHNVNTFRVTKPEGFIFEPGQATDLNLQRAGWENEKRPFTFTCLPSDPWLEFTIKSYDDHPGVTHQLRSLKKGDEFEISDAWGAIAYQGEGIFLAGGAGVTPFISIFRQLHKDGKTGTNKLFFSNKMEKDIILKEEFEKILGANFINIISRQTDTKYLKGRIDREFLQKQVRGFDQPFYVCGPDPFVTDILRDLQELGAHADSLVFEK